MKENSRMGLVPKEGVMKIVLVQPPNGFFAPEIHLLYEPFQLELLGGYLNLDGHEVRLVDARLEVEPFPFGDGFQPELAVLTSLGSSAESVRETACRLKKCMPELLVAVVAHEEEAREYDDCYVDLVLLGEGGSALREAAKALAEHLPLSEVPGLAFPGDAGLRFSGARSLEPLAALPEPDWSLADRYREHYFPWSKACTAKLSTLSCPGGCRFCALTSGGMGVELGGSASGERAGDGPPLFCGYRLLQGAAPPAGGVPGSPPAAAGTARTPRPKSRRHLLKILVAEDEQASREMLTLALERIGSCAAVADGQDAFDSLVRAYESGIPYRLVFLDIVMPVIDGFGVLRLLRAYEQRRGILPKEWTKVVMVSALGDPAHVMESFNSLCDGYLVKPFTLAQIAGLIKDLKLR